MTNLLLIRDAKPEDAKCLSSLAIRSKAYWGYSKAFMKICTRELTITNNDIDNDDNYFMVAILKNEIVGFYSFEKMLNSEIQLSDLFVEPTKIRTGVGRKLIENAKSHALSIGAQKINIQGDPHAEKFYISAGGELTGRKESENIPGRFLPIFQISLN